MGIIEMNSKHAAARDEPAGADESAGVQSVEIGVKVLSALIELGPSSMLKTIAEQAGMTPPKAHRYLASLGRSGLVDRNLQTGGYRLGPLAVRLGLAALRHLNIIDVVTPLLAELRDEIGFTVGLAIWGSHGPTFVRFEETNDVVIISIRPGSVMPILTSSTGRVFGAFSPAALTNPLIRAELRTARNSAAAGPRVKTRTEIDAMLDAVRQRRMANAQGDLNVGIHALSAPIFDHLDSLVGVMSAMGGANQFDASFEGKNAAALAAKVRSASRQMGCP